MDRRTFCTTPLLTAVALTTLPGLSGCGGGGGDAGTPATVAPDPTTVHAATLTIDAAASGSAVNRRVLGSNVQWVDGGDNLLDAAGAFDPGMLGLARALAPTVLRYPGGLQSDAFHFEQPTNQHAFTRAVQPTRMDTRRLLELCEATGAEPFITVNVVTGTAEEAARWVRAVNVTRIQSTATGRTLPRVDFWEIGNEPYLKVESRPDLDIAPAEFARRANAFITAMRAVDPTIRIGIPVTLETTNGLPISAYAGYTRQVLGALSGRFDFVSVHNAYLPLQFGGALDAAAVAALTPAALAGAESVRDSFTALRALLAELRPGAAIPLAVTEHAPLFSLGGGATDDWSTTPLGAIYLADLLRVFAETPDLLLANHWSLSGNGRFGAIGGGGGSGVMAFDRAAAAVLKLAGRALQGRRLDPAIICDSRTTPSAGLVPARAALPLLAALVCRDGGTLRALLIHKDTARRAQLRVDLRGAGAAGAASASLTTLSTADLTAAADRPDLWQRTVTSPAGGASFALGLPPHSVSLLELTL